MQKVGSLFFVRGIKRLVKYSYPGYENYAEWYARGTRGVPGVRDIKSRLGGDIKSRLGGDIKSRLGEILNQGWGDIKSGLGRY